MRAAPRSARRALKVAASVSNKLPLPSSTSAPILGCSAARRDGWMDEWTDGWMVPDDRLEMRDKWRKKRQRRLKRKRRKMGALQIDARTHRLSVHLLRRECPSLKTLHRPVHNEEDSVTPTDDSPAATLKVVELSLATLFHRIEIHTFSHPFFGPEFHLRGFT
ncbi:hypothetical protein BDZ88DRAFT_1859 [Geranomyces variabilis]|nr:hypothetical protein BDZ88DRAFT_1859 [Geranomyces variabilis]